jgi:hypothetical protein
MVDLKFEEEKRSEYEEELENIKPAAYFPIDGLCKPPERRRGFSCSDGDCRGTE